MKLKTKLITGVLAGAMLALPVISAPAFAQPANSVNPNYVERVNWWHHDYDDHYGRGYGRGYDRGYYGNPYYGRGLSGYRGYGACANAGRLERQARIDRRTGHPAAGFDVAQQARWASSRCY